MHVLLLGGTTEASAAAKTLAGAGIRAVFSYAGRTNTPVTQPLPTRVGGFGGVDGLVAFLKAEKISHVIDATHPFAAGMSVNASDACAEVGIPLVRFERAPWQPEAGDNWTQVPRLEDIPAALPDTPARVFLAIGKQQISLFTAKPQHHYLHRLVDVPDAPLPLPNTSFVLDRGPFNVANDTALMRSHKITHIVAKNSGGTGARAKLDAARSLDLPVIMANRPALPAARNVSTTAEVMTWLDHNADRGV